MAKLDNLDIVGLTREAETGNGCALREEIDKLSYEERWQALKAIEAQNKVNRSKDPDIIELHAHTNTGREDRKPGMDLHINRKGLFRGNPILYQEFINSADRTFSSTCTDVNVLTWDVIQRKK